MSTKWIDDNIPEDIRDSNLFKFNVDLGDKQVRIDMISDIGIDYDHISEQLEETPSQFAFWAAIYSELRLQSDKLERMIKAKKGQVVEKLVTDASDAQVRITDKQVQAIVEKDEELNKLEAKLLVTNKHCGKVYFMVECLRMKCDNLRTLAGFAKIELNQQS